MTVNVGACSVGVIMAYKVNGFLCVSPNVP